MKKEKNLSKAFPDFYNLLDIPFGASSDLIKKQYRELAKIAHPDNKNTGSNEKFQNLSFAYRILIDEKKRKLYDDHYLKIFSFDFLKESNISRISRIVLDEKRIVFPNSISTRARYGLLRVGLRTKDRRKYSGINFDVSVIVKKKEIPSGVVAKIPLTVRILCPQCLGSDIYCESCAGKGNYKGNRALEIIFEPYLLVNDRIYEFELGRFRPDKFVHFKKKKLKVKIEIYD